MSFLAPLYALGLAAVVAPIVFHLIRRSPRGEVPFSSLMFLAPTPPRLTRRSRLDQLLLLLLRAAAISLLAFAFARPFLRQTAQLGFDDVERRRIAVLIDTSASMRRGELWPKARALGAKAIADALPADQVALYAFDVAARPLVSFEQSAALDPAHRRAAATAVLDRTTPSWAGTNLGQALIETVAAIEAVADTSEKAGRMPRRVVLISDLGAGSRIDALGDFEWPSDVELELKTVSESGSNAGLAPLADSVETETTRAAKGRRVRVVNDAASRQETFLLRWVDEKGAAAGVPLDVYVPPGESRVMRVPEPSAAAAHASLRLEGDSYSFDNALYFADQKQEATTVLYIGADRPDDPSGLLYYLARIFHDTPGRSVHVTARPPSGALEIESDRTIALVVLADQTTSANIDRLGRYVRAGGTLLDVVTAPEQSAALAALTGASSAKADEAALDHDVMLGEIAFDHPLFAALAGPQFNDFTKIRFRKYRRIDPNALPGARVLARFETGDPAIIEKTDGKGRIVVFTSGWQPADSQLARSSKFVPLCSALLEARNAPAFGGKSFLVNERVPLPAGESDKALVVRKPDGSQRKAEAGSSFFAETALPGIYTVESADGARSFAVNLDPLESKTSPLHVETLEQFGCRLADHAAKRLDPAQLRQMFNAELENRQKLWRWLLLATLGILIVETWLAGRRARERRPRRAEAALT
jgi:Aerotolerance regulator N-terminal/von Willebrand factor type A domain